MVCKRILRLSAIFYHAMQLSFDDYGNEHHLQYLRRQTNHLEDKIVNYYKLCHNTECRRDWDFICSPYSLLQVGLLLYYCI